MPKWRIRGTGRSGRPHVVRPWPEPTVRLPLALLALCGGGFLIFFGQAVFRETTEAAELSFAGEVWLTTAGLVDSADLELSVDISGFDRTGIAYAELLTTLHVRSAKEVTFWLWLLGPIAQDIPAGHREFRYEIGFAGPSADEFTPSGSWVLQAGVPGDLPQNRLTLLGASVRDVDLDGKITLRSALQATEMVHPTTSGLALQLPSVGPLELLGSDELTLDIAETEYEGPLEGVDSLPEGYTHDYAFRQPSQVTSVVKVEGFSDDDSLQANPPPDSWEGSDIGPRAVWGPSRNRLSVIGSLSNQTKVATNQRRQFLAGVAVGLGGGLLVLAVEQAVEAYGAHKGRRRHAHELKRAERTAVAERRYRRARRPR